MYQRQVRLNVNSLMSGLLVIALFAPIVGAQTPGPFSQKRVSITNLNPATANQQAIDALGIKTDEPRPSIKDLMFSEQSPPNRNSSGANFNGWTVDKREASEQEKDDPDRDGLLTIPHWSDSFAYHGLTYKYTMVGTDPNDGSGTTTIPTVLIPIRFVFENGLVFDASADSIDGQTSIQGIINSPIFQSHAFNVGGVSVGNTQYGDAFQRANFWDSVSRGSSGYHVLLGQPTVAPAFEVFVPNNKVFFVTDPVTGTLVPLVDFSVLAVTIGAIQHSDVTPQSLPIVVWGNVFGFGASGFHGSYQTSAGEQTYIATGYHPRHIRLREDVYILAHEVIEWLNDPFVDNFTPGWDFALTDYPHCFSSAFVADKLEVGDVLEFFLESDVPINVGTATYHVADGVFLDYFTRKSPSRSANGQYTFFGLTNSPSAPCAGHVEITPRTFEFPNAKRTIARGINNRGWIVGDFRDASNLRHGFLYDGRGFTQLDYPGSIFTVPNKISDAGQVVGTYFDSVGLPHGFSYLGGKFTSIDFPGSIDHTALARGVNSGGDIVGQYDETVEISHGFAYLNGQYHTLDTPFAQQTDALAINDWGEIVGYVYDDPFNGPFRGFSFDRNVFTRFDFPAAVETLPWALNNLEMQGGTFFDPVLGGDGYVTILGYPYEVYANVFGMNDKGQIVGSRFDFSSFRTVGYVANLPNQNDDASR